ncbi:membrane bound O-acyl transferase MBOAT family protein [Calothrix sp. NIES-4071]|nr:membrane bound O-acyl transferase MBOAT family protein [Calothrix sp. NIES-4071]BAZ60991.1 membrane bound O-acyl transferase MBOAT family protein [Calothrix sp. NIES-4105]
MSLISILYGLFLLGVLGVYWSVRQEKVRLCVLLAASVVFYYSYQPQYLPLLLVLIYINYRLGLEIGQNTSPGEHTQDWHMSNNEWQYAQADWNRRRLSLVWLGIVLNIFLLFGFKYLIPFLKFALPEATIKGFGLDTFKLLAPLGISYFVFECIAYLVDVYRGAPATNDLIKFATYKLLFFKVTSGPITRFHKLANQFKASLPTANIISEALWLIARGAVKKGLFADNIGIFVDICFGNLQRAGSTDIWLATFAYGLQLYLDFSGYVDIARGSAMLFGLVLPENFDSPYFSTSIADFWRRWHMTLGDWLRNYLYFPLGGSRVSLERTCVNLVTVMVVCGIWHGAALGFIVWGFWHGLALVVHRLVDKLSNRIEFLEHFWQSPIGVIVAWFVTQLMVFTSWIWFRLPDLRDSTEAAKRLWGRTADAQFSQLVYIEALKISQFQVMLLLSAVFLSMAIVYFFKRHLKLEFNWHLKLLFVPLCFYIVWLLAPQGSLPFIYFDY